MKYLDLEGLNTLKKYIKDNYAPIGGGISDEWVEILKFFQYTTHQNFLAVNANGFVYNKEEVSLGKMYSGSSSDIETNNAVLDAATSTTAGVMSAEDKAKLDKISEIPYVLYFDATDAHMTASDDAPPVASSYTVVYNTNLDCFGVIANNVFYVGECAAVAAIAPRVSGDSGYCYKPYPNRIYVNKSNNILYVSNATSSDAEYTDSIQPANVTKIEDSEINAVNA